MDRKNNKNNQQSGQGQIHKVQAREHHEVTNSHDFQREHGALVNQQHGQQEHHDHKTKSPSHHDHKLTIFIDHQPYYIEHAQVTGADIRNMAVPPIGSDKDIFHVMGGSDAHRKVDETEVIAINPHESKQGRHFVSAAKSNGNGSCDGCPSHDEIARKAYEIYEERGHPQGQDLQHWQEAEKQLKSGSNQHTHRFATILAGIES